ncbi:hypothetical protein BU23DRAFT_81126 [Bimuria novae-zelandiae CBS 107.79]|uniref:Uncharacterized protein n=1 Tax=Bimuria novae-zelandiae CBS 107.79 TaxID=1447943 RepID=A0A6A5VDV1_9PLEO|nr:hypothetical protein BU23DRAFT_81126 [Bimuria novae-zelandiae CBS 107.79]
MAITAMTRLRSVRATRHLTCPPSIPYPIPSFVGIAAPVAELSSVVSRRPSLMSPWLHIGAVYHLVDLLLPHHGCKSEQCINVHHLSISRSMCYLCSPTVCLTQVCLTTCSFPSIYRRHKTCSTYPIASLCFIPPRFSVRVPSHKSIGHPAISSTAITSSGVGRSFPFAYIPTSSQVCVPSLDHALSFHVSTQTNVDML